MELGGNWEDHFPLAEFAYNNSYQASIQMAPFGALYGRPRISPLCWDNVSESIILGSNMVRDTSDKTKVIHEKLITAQSRQKSYADCHRRPLEFEIGDYVFQKVSPRRGLHRFGQSGKLTLRFIGSFEILVRIGAVAHRLALPPQWSSVHNVLHVSMLRKYYPDSSYVLD